MADLTLRVPYSYRTLTFDPVVSILHGGDVAEYQTYLEFLGYDLGPFGADGYYGKRTHLATLAMQTELNLKRDGLVGPLTMHRVIWEVAKSVAVLRAVDPLRLIGQAEKESSARFGVASPTNDRGVPQTNRAIFTDEAWALSPSALAELAARTRRYHDVYVSYGFRDGTTRSGFTNWDYAQGAWNSPAGASFLAIGPSVYSVRSITPTEEARLRSYIADVSRLARLGMQPTT